MMDSPEPSKKNVSSSASTLNATPSSESPQVQESPFLRFVNTLSPIKPVKASHVVGQSFLGLNSPPLVFKSPRVCYRETHFMERSQSTQLLTGETSQSENGGTSLGEAPGDSSKPDSQQPRPERFITDTREVFDSRNGANTQNCSPPSSVDEYLADPRDVDRMYLANQDVEHSTDAAEASSLSDLTQSKKSTLKFDRKDCPGDKAEDILPLSEESEKGHQEKPAYGEEPGKIAGEKNDVEWASQEHRELESNSASGVFEKQSCHDSLPQDFNGCEDYNKMVSTSHVTSENLSQDGSEASLKYHGIRRRCLQFEEGASDAFGSNKSNVKLNATSSEMKTVKPSEHISSSFPQRGSGNFPVTGPKPSGIGLHLNSIINAMPTGRATTTSMRLSDGLQGMKPKSSISLYRVENMKRSVLTSNVDGQSLVDIRNESHDIAASVATNSFISGNSEEFNQPSPSKKKRKTSSTADDNGPKRCNCKKSKCLKLYCDCFSAGPYCSESCTCQGCLNRPEYAETVTETKQQIESRNPLAFAPKIVQSTTDISSNMEDINLTTPSSARHKRGCNCKRSMCLKKYCECYQANVGCSSGCRCEGCKNIYGKKEDYVASEHSLSKERVGSSVEKGGSDSTFPNKPEAVASKTHYDLQGLSPITPSLQCSDQGKEAAKSRLLSGNFQPSPESDVSMFSSQARYTESSENLHTSQALPETNEMLGTAPYDSQIDCSNMNTVDQSSPNNSGVILPQLIPVSNPESMSCASSSSSRTFERTNIPQSLLSQGSFRQLPGGSLRWRSSPVTPTTRAGETQYLQCPESDSRLFDILENDTPDILKEASTPITSVKVNSPTQKRVSPPQSHHHGIGSNSSGGLRSGRKFILQAVPPFPPLTPCVDSKGNSDEDLNEKAKDKKDNEAKDKQSQS
ncbi:protein tesmin/TSO1-like CXC 2 [Abrus precatorius]|uniref:Protein tesmin/TSO1-like CXC 2 n=1 Tax=Abrus precatorius TaxID=3816 RepID=A0A8B8JPE1_ABRPR|nr:protein tesmin/TSO1-like CXC 2 [Abrus precatorius]